MAKSSCDPKMPQAVNEGTRIVIVGKTGNGKSTLANILLQKPDVKAPKSNQATSSQTDDQATTVNSGNQGFTVGPGFRSTAEKCGYKESPAAWGRHMKVVDTHGLCDTDTDTDTDTDIGQVLLELSTITSLSTPGPHAILFVIRCDNRFTAEEYDSFKKILEMFTDDAKRFLVVVFSRGDHLEDTIEDQIANGPEALQEVMTIVGDNYAVISKTDDTEVREREVRHLLEKIDRVSKNGEVFYINGDLQKQTEAMNEEIEKITKERNVDWKEAEFLVKKGLAVEEERFKGLHKRIIMISLSSAAFIVLAGITGGVAAVPLATATVQGAVAGASVRMFAGFLGMAILQGAVFANTTKPRLLCEENEKCAKKKKYKCAIM